MRRGHRRLESHKSSTGSDSWRVFQQQSASTSTRRWSAAAQKTSNLLSCLPNLNHRQKRKRRKARIQVFVSPMAEAACAGMLSRSGARPLSPLPFGLLIRSELSLSPTAPARCRYRPAAASLPHALAARLSNFLLSSPPSFFQPQVSHPEFQTE